MTVEELYLSVRDRFRRAGLDSPDLDAKLLVSSLLNMSLSDLVLDGHQGVADDQLELVERAVSRREGGEPVGRILGEREFWGLPFKMNAATLEPRPDTEALVEAVLARVQPGEAFTFADIGTGTGAIAVSLLHECPEATGVAVDLSLEALDCASGNAALNDVADRFLPLCGSYLDMLSGPFDVIVSNPPYIRSDVIPQLARDVQDHDPMLALDGGPDGLIAYREITARASEILRIGGLLAFEIGFDQAEDVLQIMQEHGFVNLEVIDDLGGNNRAILGTCT